MLRLGKGEFVMVNRSTADGRPLQFTWRHHRYQVSKLEWTDSSSANIIFHEHRPCKTYRVKTTSGLRCTLSRSPDQVTWKMERLLNSKGV